MFQSFSVAPQYSKKINRKIFLGQKHEHGTYQTSRNIIREAFGNCFLQK